MADVQGMSEDKDIVPELFFVCKNMDLNRGLQVSTPRADVHENVSILTE